MLSVFYRSLTAFTLILAVSSGALGAAQQKLKFRTLDKTLGWPGETLAGNECYGNGQGFGPFDNRDPKISTSGGYSHVLGHTGYTVRQLVEGGHFLPVTEQLIRGKKGGVDADLDYTLRAIPNHYRALWAMSRYYLRLRRETGEHLILDNERTKVGYPPAECYFHRARAFAPDDVRVLTVFGTYLHRRGFLQQAFTQYSASEEANPNDPELVYNIGLLHVDMGNLDKARDYAQRAAELGYPLSGLQRKIKRLEGEASARTDSVNQ